MPMSIGIDIETRIVGSDLVACGLEPPDAWTPVPIQARHRRARRLKNADGLRGASRRATLPHPERRAQGFLFATPPHQQVRRRDHEHG